VFGYSCWGNANCITWVWVCLSGRINSPIAWNLKKKRQSCCTWLFDRYFAGRSAVVNNWSQASLRGDCWCLVCWCGLRVGNGITLINWHAGFWGPGSCYCVCCDCSTLCFYSKLATVLSLNTRIHQMFCPILVNVCCAKQGFEAAGNHVETFSVCVIHLVKCILMYFLTNRVNFITLQLYHIWSKRILYLDTVMTWWNGNVLVENDQVKEEWRKYMENLLNKENIWDNETTCENVEGPVNLLEEMRFWRL